MVHRVSRLGIVGMGALGQALERFLLAKTLKEPNAILFCVKAFDLEQALTEQSHQWPGEIPFVILCNGYVWPTIQKISNKLGSRQIRIGMTTIGSTIQPDGQIKIFSENTMTAWGNWGSSNRSPIPTELETLHAFPNSAWHDDIRPLIRQKWILNVVINTLGGAYRLASNRYVSSHKEEAEHLLEEACHLSRVLFPGLPPIQSMEEIRQILWRLVQATGDNENSLAKDVRLGRRTESDFLAGMALMHEGYPILKRFHALIVDQPSPPRSHGLQ